MVTSGAGNGQAVVPFGEAVKVDAVTLQALVNLYQAVSAKHGIPLEDGNGVGRRQLVPVEAYLVAMIDELIGRNPHGQYVIDCPLIEHVLRRGVVGVGLIAIAAMVHIVGDNPVLQPIDSIGCSRVDALRLPVVVGFAEEREAVLPMLRSMCIRVAGGSGHVAASLAFVVLHVEVVAHLLIELFVGLIAHLAQRVE